MKKAFVSSPPTALPGWQQRTSPSSTKPLHPPKPLRFEPEGQYKLITLTSAASALTTGIFFIDYSPADPLSPPPPLRFRPRKLSPAGALLQHLESCLQWQEGISQDYQGSGDKRDRITGAWGSNCFGGGEEAIFCISISKSGGKLRWGRRTEKRDNPRGDIALGCQPARSGSEAGIAGPSSSSVIHLDASLSPLCTVDMETPPSQLRNQRRAQRERSGKQQKARASSRVDEPGHNTGRSHPFPHNTASGGGGIPRGTACCPCAGSTHTHPSRPANPLKGLRAAS